MRMCCFILSVLVGCGGWAPAGLGLYSTESFAPSFDEQGIKTMQHMGPVIIDEGVNFATYSERAERIELLLFDDPESDRPTQALAMHRFGDVWSLYVAGIGEGQHYGYRAWGPNWTYSDTWYPGSIHGFIADVDDEGNRFNPNKLLLDPWAKALSRDHDWSRASLASGPARAQLAYGAAAKSVVVESRRPWSEGEAEWLAMRRNRQAPGHRPQDLVIYEVHVKGFTADPASGVNHPGTFRGLGEMAPYLADLGINAVELLPTHEKPLDGGYWGYMTLNFFAPEVSYAADPDPRRVIDEFKAMVEALHAHDIEVILDVVYNHTGEGGLWRERIYQDDFSPDPGTRSTAINLDPEEVASIYSFRGLDNNAYYALNPGGRTYWNNTGVGNQTRPNHTPMRRLIMDSLRWHVEELHVDGFRFDLAGILGEQDGNYNEWDDPANTVLQDIIDDPVLQAANTRIIAESWTAGGNYGPLIGAYPAASVGGDDRGWGEWNARFRDWWRSFVNDDNWALNSQEGSADGGFVMTGSQGQYGHNGRRPYHSINFVTCHDGFTLYDLFSYDQKRNGCSPLNPVCCSDPASPWCQQDDGEAHNRSRNWGMDQEVFKRQQMRNLLTAMMISHGTPMLLGGDEWMRTQLGNNNAYSTGADNPFNWFQWGVWQSHDARHRMHDFTRQAIALRRRHQHAFSPAAYGGGAPFAWKSPANTDDVDWAGKALMIHYFDAEAGPEVAVLINMSLETRSFQLPEGRQWFRVLDTQSWWDDQDFLMDAAAPSDRDQRRSYNAWNEDAAQVAGAVDLPAHSIVIVETR